jgi:hypothetical protein
LKQLQEAVENTLEKIGIGNDFLNRTLKAQHLRETMNKWDCIKLNSFYTAKKKQSPDSRDSPQYGLCQLLIWQGSNIQNLQKTQKLNPQRINIPMTKWIHKSNREFSKEEVQMAHKYLKKCSTSLVIRDANQNNT